ncbi:MAG: cobyrinic acid a,c-diamide synthase [Gammaproteobacteria bacterium]|nr:cobyrinic acid a,c-diamide synthase [Gammaproteobacteria bacterium]MBJ54773.1 cobyrinic acid a,c-diamide synthase [Gammaproteobacteria bacterium]HBN16376.1 cobyrinic acid a,c-diamide synthase [Pseudohongiella sp.]
MGMHPIQVLAVTGGKGGVGKTSISVNLSLAMAQAGKRVVLMDADLGLANVDILMGVKADKTIAEVMAGVCDLRDVMIETQGIKIIPASSGVQTLVNMGANQHAGIIHAFSELSDELDVLVIDTAAGISDSVVSFVRAAQEVLVVVCDEPSSMTDAYALVKLLNRDCQLRDFRILANMTRSPQEGRNLFNRFAAVTSKFLDVNLRYAGDIPFDETVRKAVQRQKPVLLSYPGGRAADGYRRLASEVLGWPVRTEATGQLEFFVERLVQGMA